MHGSHLVDRWVESDVLCIQEQCIQEEELAVTDFASVNWIAQIEEENLKIEQDLAQVKVPNMFDVLGTENTWQGKMVWERAVCTAEGGESTEKKIVLLTWPVLYILEHCALMMTYQALANVQATCKNFCHRTRRIAELRAISEIQKTFRNEQQIFKFCERFALFDFALQYRDMLNDQTLMSLCDEELQAMYNEQFDKIQMMAPLNWNNFAPGIEGMWKTFGCKAFLTFFKHSVIKKPSNVKLLMSYRKTWKVIMNIVGRNAKHMLDKKSPETVMLLGGSFDGGHPGVGFVAGKWPNIRVIVHGPADLFEWKNPQCMCTFGFGAEAPTLQWKGESNTIWKLKNGELYIEKQTPQQTQQQTQQQTPQQTPQQTQQQTLHQMMLQSMENTMSNTSKNTYDFERLFEKFKRPKTRT
jgi:hypothetical protein